MINQAQPINKTKTNSKIHRLAFEITSYMCVYGADLVAILGSGRASSGAGWYVWWWVVAEVAGWGCYRPDRTEVGEGEDVCVWRER